MPANTGYNGHKMVAVVVVVILINYAMCRCFYAYRLHFLLARQAEVWLAYVLLLLLSFFFIFDFHLFKIIIWSKQISEPTKPIFTKFSGLVDMWLLMFNLVFVSRSLKGCCHGNQFSKLAEIGDMPSFLGLRIGCNEDRCDNFSWRLYWIGLYSHSKN